MKSLPLQMQQNLILAVTLIGGIVFSPHNVAPHSCDALPQTLLPIRGAQAQASTTVAEHSREAQPIPASEITTRSLESKPIPHSVRAGSATKGHLPKAMVGDWDFFSADNAASQSPTNDTRTRFTFRLDGSYSYLYSVRQRHYGRAVESTTVEEGTVTFNRDSTFVMHPNRGRFTGNTEGTFVNRAMDAGELGPRTLYWEWRSEGGKRKLYLGPDAGSASRFEAA